MMNQLVEVLKVRRGLVMLSTFCFLLYLLTGCGRKQPSTSEDIVRQADALYRAYLAGDRIQARQSMDATLRLIENSNLEMVAKAEYFCFTYGRLYVLENTHGNSAIAEALLVQTRYWYLRHRELSGSSKEEAADAVGSFTGEKCAAFVEKWDKSHTDGKGPNYLRK